MSCGIRKGFLAHSLRAQHHPRIALGCIWKNIDSCKDANKVEDEEVFLANFIKKPEEFLAQNLCAPGTPSSFSPHQRLQLGCKLPRLTRRTNWNWENNLVPERKSQLRNLKWFIVCYTCILSFPSDTNIRTYFNSKAPGFIIKAV